MTLDEYLAQQKASPLEGIVPKLEGVRLANDGKDKELWKDAIKLNKDEEEAYFSGKVGRYIVI
jgi:plasminogen activator inhibitor 1 RNA-binding protein